LFNGAQGLIPLEAKPACEIEDSCVLAHSGRSRAACPEDESKIALFGTVTRLFQRVNALLSATHSRRPLLRVDRNALRVQDECTARLDQVYGRADLHSRDCGRLLHRCTLDASLSRFRRFEVRNLEIA
jgi:hypothetical protein